MDKSKIYLDGNNSYDVIDDFKREFKAQEKDREDSLRLSLKLKPMIDKIYLDAHKPLPWKYY